MAELKTTRNAASVTDFLGAVADPVRRADADAQVLRELVTNVFRRYDSQTVVAGSP